MSFWKRGIGEDYLDNDRAKVGKKTGKIVKDNLTDAQKTMVLDMGEKYVGGRGGGSEMFWIMLRRTVTQYSQVY